MTCTSEFVRGGTIKFTATVFGPTGDPAPPTTATLTLAYNGTKEVLDMDISGSNVSALWDSSPAPHGTVYWSIKAVGSNKVVSEGALRLTANLANG